MPTILQRFRKAWNVFTSRSPTDNSDRQYGGYGIRPDRRKLRYTNERTTVSAIYNQISIDCARIDVRHVQTDGNKRYRSEISSGLNSCLSLSANIDQTGRNLIQDIVLSMLDEGCVAVVPVDTTVDPKATDSFDILSLRTGRITQWFPSEVRVEVYNDRIGKKQEVPIPKSQVAIIENPFYAIMNEPNSTLRRLTHKLALMDKIDDSDYGKIDLIIQLPYALNNDRRKAEANQRREQIETQLRASKYGISYIDATEHITQLNRSLDNHLLDQINSLKEELYSQLGLTKEVFSGTADEQTMLNYYNRTIEPIMSAISEEMTRKFIGKNARTRGQTIRFFRDPFKLVPVNSIADIADKFTRNEILSSNEVRGLIGFKPVDDPAADELRNKNLNQTPGQENPLVSDELDSTAKTETTDDNTIQKWVDDFLSK